MVKKIVQTGFPQLPCEFAEFQMLKMDTKEYCVSKMNNFWHFSVVHFR